MHFCFTLGEDAGCVSFPWFLFPGNGTMPGGCQMFLPLMSLDWGVSRVPSWLSHPLCPQLCNWDLPSPSCSSWMHALWSGLKSPHMLACVFTFKGLSPLVLVQATSRLPLLTPTAFSGTHFSSHWCSWLVVCSREWNRQGFQSERLFLCWFSLPGCAKLQLGPSHALRKVWILCSFLCLLNCWCVFNSCHGYFQFLCWILPEHQNFPYF